MSRRRIEGKPFSLKKHKPLVQCYQDDHPFQVYIKPAQVGVSELAICKAGHALEIGHTYWKTGKNGLNVGYLFPTNQALLDFSRERISALAEESDELATMFGNAEFDAALFKKIGRSYLYLRGAWSKKALKSFAADVLILDEYDEMDEMAIELADKRLRASNVRRKIAISTPTKPGYGIHGLYLQSDQKVWEIPCGTCHEWVELDFFRDVWANGEFTFDIWQNWQQEQASAAVWDTYCPHCKNHLDRFADGKWVAKNPEVKGISGYHIPALCFPIVSLKDIVLPLISNNPTKVSEAYRSDLGLPYMAEGSQLNEGMLDRLPLDLDNGKLPKNANWQRVTMGVDVGTRLHYRVSGELQRDGQRIVIDMGAVKEWDDLSHIMREHKVRMCVIDANPEGHKCREWQTKHKGRVLRAFYPNGMGGNLWRPKEGEGVVQINRTMAMDAVYDNVASGTEAWPIGVVNDPEVRANMLAPMRTSSLGMHGAEVVTWIHTAPDHFFHASVYDYIASLVLPKRKFGSAIAQGKTSGWRKRSE